MNDLTLLKHNFDYWRKYKYSAEQITNHLSAHGFSPELIKSAIQSYIKYKEQKRIARGWICMGIGSVIGLISFIFTVTDVMPEWRNFYIFGLTTVAICIAMYGSYLVFEKE